MNQLGIMGGVARMSSVDIASLCEKRHDNVMADIRRMIESLGIYESPEILGDYIDSLGRSYRCFYLDHDLTMTLVAGYHVKLRYRIVQRWRELEEGSGRMPKSFSEALQLAADVQRRNEEQERLLKEAEPKVQFFEAVSASGDLLEMSEAAKILNYKEIGRNNLFKILRGRGVFMSGGSQPKQEHISSGRFVYKEYPFTSGGRDRIGKTVYVTQKGLAWIKKILDDEGYRPLLERGA